MRKNRLFVLGIITMFVAILSLTLVSGTMARYTSTVSGSDSVSVAKWAWKYEGTDLDLSSTSVVFDLLETRYDSDGINSETDVKDGVIAPGTSGEFTLDFTNNSEVRAEYTVDFTVTNTAGIPLEYSVNGEAWSSSLSDITSGVSVAMGADSKVNVQWRWAYNVSDSQNSADTLLGINGASLTVAISVTFTQVD